MQKSEKVVANEIPLVVFVNGTCRVRPLPCRSFAPIELAEQAKFQSEVFDDQGLQIIFVNGYVQALPCRSFAPIEHAERGNFQSEVFDDQGLQIIVELANIHRSADKRWVAR